jgi:hypothetical protein
VGILPISTCDGMTCDDRKNRLFGSSTIKKDMPRCLVRPGW